MEITGLDYSNKSLIVQIEDTKTAEVTAKDFFSFMSTWKGWLFDCDNCIISIPQGRFSYHSNDEEIKELALILRGSLGCGSYSFEQFRKRFATDMPEYVLEYILSLDIVFEDEDEGDFRPVSYFLFSNRIGKYDDPQAEAYGDFRRAQMI